MTVAAILHDKGRHIVAVDPAARIAEVVATLAARRIGAAPVLDRAGQLLGIVSERDIVIALAQHGAAALDRTAAQLMTRNVSTATPATTVKEAMAMMTDGRFRHLPVMEAGMLVGIVSIGDVVKARIAQQAQDVDSLRAYVAGAA